MKKKEIRAQVLDSIDSIDRIVDRLKFIENAVYSSDSNELEFSGYELQSTIHAIVGDLESVGDRLHLNN